MKNRHGFTLAELVLSVFIFSFIATSLATIVATTNRHMFQNYRQNLIKTNVLLSMKSVQNKLSMATRVDSPTRSGAITDSGTILAFAQNVDQTTGCYPVNAAAPASWHYFCLSGPRLYYYTGNIAYNAATACGKAAPAIWNPGTGYAVPGCGGGGGTMLMENVVPTLPTGALFSRRASDGVNEVDTVRVLLRSQWFAAPSGLGSTQRDVDTRLDSVVRFNRSL